MDAIGGFLRDYGLQLSSWALFLATFALAIAAFVQSRDNRAMRQQVAAIEGAREKDRLLDRQQAALVATILHEDGKFVYMIAIENRGRGGAREISVRLDGSDVAAMPNHNQHPLTLLGPGAVYTYSLPKPGMNVLYPEVVTVEWADESGVPGHFESTVGVIR